MSTTGFAARRRGTARRCSRDDDPSAPPRRDPGRCAACRGRLVELLPATAHVFGVPNLLHRGGRPCPAATSPANPARRPGTARSGTRQRPDGSAAVTARRSGQALVEAALVFPVMLFAGLVFVEIGALLAAQADQDRRTGVLASWVGSHPGEDPAVAEAAILPGCAIDYATIPPDLVRAGASCQYAPLFRNVWDGTTISTDGLAVVAATPAP